MVWNYRIVEFRHEEHKTTEHALCEVYYADEGATLPTGYCRANMVSFCDDVDLPESGKSEIDLRWTLERALEAADKPVLKATDFKGEEHGI